MDIVPDSLRILEKIPNLLICHFQIFSPPVEVRSNFKFSTPLRQKVHIDDSWRLEGFSSRIVVAGVRAFLQRLSKNLHQLFNTVIYGFFQGFISTKYMCLSDRSRSLALSFSISLSL